MTNIVIETAVQHARAVALSGAPDQFDQALEAVVTLDRGGDAPLRELRMLAVVAAARRADLTAVEAALQSVGALAPSDWKSLHQWLLAAPEMQHDAYAAFVRDLDRRMRRSTNRSPARRLTAALAVLLVASCLSLLVLAWRVSARDPADQTQSVITGMLDGQPSTVLAGMPACTAAWEKASSTSQRSRCLSTRHSPPAWRCFKSWWYGVCGSASAWGVDVFAPCTLEAPLWWSSCSLK